MASGIRVLHVDDDPHQTALVAEFLTRHDDRITVESLPDAGQALDRLDGGSNGAVDCIVSDYEMPGLDGLEFLREVRDGNPRLPFILFTGTGSEEVASEAISAGATDYLRKTPGSDQYRLLANRIVHSVDRLSKARDLARFKHIVQAAGDGVYTLDARGHFTEVNAAIAQQTGYEREELLGSHVSLLVDEAELGRGQAAIRDLLDDEGPEAVTFEVTVYPKDDDPVPAELTIALLPRRNGEFAGTVGIARDISARKRATSRFESLFENIPDPATIVRFDDGSPVVDGANSAFESTFGYQAEDVVGDSLNELIVPDDRIERAREIDRSAEAGTQTECEVRRETADGELRDFLFRNALIEQSGTEEPAAHFGVYTDITERKARERELERFETVLEEVSDGVYILDAEGRYTYVNTYFADRVGFDREELIGSTPAKLIDDEAIARFEDAIRDMMAGDRDSFATEIRVDPQGGEPYPAEAKIAPIMVDGRFLGTVGIVRDITERKERERELQRQNQRLDEFAKIVSHDLRNPLNVAMGRLSLAQDACTCEQLDAVSDAHDRMAALIDDLLRLAREGQSLDGSEAVALSDIAQVCWQHVSTESARLQVDSDAVLRGDDRRIRQLFENLFRNAIDHNDPPVTVTVDDLDDGFYVADDGAGIPADEREEVFDPGYSTRSGGTGLGLRIVKRVAEVHGWHVRLTASTDGGARFVFTDVERAT